MIFIPFLPRHMSQRLPGQHFPTKTYDKKAQSLIDEYRAHHFTKNNIKRLKQTFQNGNHFFKKYSHSLQNGPTYGVHTQFSQVKGFGLGQPKQIFKKGGTAMQRRKWKWDILIIRPLVVGPETSCRLHLLGRRRSPSVHSSVHHHEVSVIEFRRHQQNVSLQTAR